MMEFVGVVKAEIHQGPGQRRQWHVIGTCQRDNLPLGTWTEISMKIFASVIESGLSNKSRVSQFSIWIEKSRSKILNIMSHKENSANLWLRKKIEWVLGLCRKESVILRYETEECLNNLNVAFLINIIILIISALPYNARRNFVNSLHS